MEPGFPQLEEEGLPYWPIAVGGDLSVDRLISAYSQGIFPWFENDYWIQWWSPDPRAVLVLDDFKVSRSFRKSIRNRGYAVTMNQAFEDTIVNCSKRPRMEHQPGEPSTWITEGMIHAYLDFHRAGYAHSIETWLGDELVGGLYGVCMGKVFSGESMFSKARDSSKVALYYLVEHLKFWDFTLIDCQFRNELFLSLGAKEIPRREYLEIVRESAKEPLSDDVWKELKVNSNRQNL